jgi:uncharacterized protein (UPF0303 family)
MRNPGRDGPKSSAFPQRADHELVVESLCAALGADDSSLRLS